MRRMSIAKNALNKQYAGPHFNHAAQVVWLDPSSAAWQQDGRTRFAAGDYPGALRCFGAALGRADRDVDGTLGSVVLNLSACALKLLRGGEAMLWASAASALDPTSGKALYRCGPSCFVRCSD